MRIDFDAGRLAFLNTTAGVHGQTIAMVGVSSGHPTIRVDLAGMRDVTFLIDTGSNVFSNGALSTRTLDQLLRARRAAMLDKIVSMGVDGAHTERLVAVDSVSLAGFAHEKQVFGEDDGSRNTLGLGYLSRYTLTLDFPSQRVILDKGKQFDRAFAPNVVGIRVKRSEHGLTVANADERRTGYRSGVREGDVIVEVNGESTSGKTPYPLRRHADAARAAGRSRAEDLACRGRGATDSSLTSAAPAATGPRP